MSPTAWSWRPCLPPGRVGGAVIWGRETALGVLRRLCASPEAGKPLRICLLPTGVVLVGESAALPWVEDIAYVTQSPEAPNLWLPVHQQPDVPLDLLARALSQRHPRQPVLLWPDPTWVVPLDRSYPLSPELLPSIEQVWHHETR